MGRSSCMARCIAHRPSACCSCTPPASLGLLLMSPPIVPCVCACPQPDDFTEATVASKRSLRSYLRKKLLA